MMVLNYYYEDKDSRVLNAHEVPDEAGAIAALIPILASLVTRLSTDDLVPSSINIEEMRSNLKVAATLYLDNDINQAFRALDDFIEIYPYNLMYKIKQL